MSSIYEDAYNECYMELHDMLATSAERADKAIGDYGLELKIAGIIHKAAAAMALDPQGYEVIGKLVVSGIEKLLCEHADFFADSRAGGLRAAAEWSRAEQNGAF